MNFNKLNHYIQQTKKNPPPKIIKKVIVKTYRKARYEIKKMNDMFFDSHVKKKHPNLVEWHYIDIDLFDKAEIDTDIAEYLCSMYLKHKYQILGSGWINAAYDYIPLGVEGNKYQMSIDINNIDRYGKWISKVLRRPNLKESQRVWSMIDTNYIPIDWQVDYKSGYRWDAKKWFRNQAYAPVPGADIKIPWELSRLHHLPQLAVISTVIKDKADSLIREFKNQVLDFIAMNPPRMGVVWTCAMDVAIRAVNLLVAYDIFSQIDSENVLNEEFKRVFSRSIYEHGLYILTNLEWTESFTANHYLANICGMVFISAYMERTEITDAWLAFSIQELIVEFDKQFLGDGTNFEGSTCYHRLSTEMVVYATTIIYGILNTDKKSALYEYNYRLLKRLSPDIINKYGLGDSSFFKSNYLERLLKAISFTDDITKPNGEVCQIGDNDSGRFINLFPRGDILEIGQAITKYKNLRGYDVIYNKDTNYFDENDLKHFSLVSAGAALFNSPAFRGHECSRDVEYCFVKSIIKDKNLNIKIPNEKNDVVKNSFDKADLSYYKQSIISFADYTTDYYLDLSKLDALYYEDFGLYIFKTDNFYFSIYAGENGQNGLGGHSHNDRLSFELFISGKDIVRDPGTYLYTALPQKRNMFRSVFAHSTIIVNNSEQNRFLSLFSMENTCNCKVHEVNKCSITCEAKFGHIRHLRSVSFFREYIKIEDYCNEPFSFCFDRNNLYSNGYGKLINDKINLGGNTVLRNSI